MSFPVANFAGDVAAELAVEFRSKRPHAFATTICHERQLDTYRRQLKSESHVYFLGSTFF